MKKFSTVILMLVISMTASAVTTKLDGVWRSGNIELTFIKDTLYMDEVDNEGFGYIYSYNEKTHVIKDESPYYDATMLMKVVKLTKTQISLYYLDDEKKQVYTFYKKKIQRPVMGF